MQVVVQNIHPYLVSGTYVTSCQHLDESNAIVMKWCVASNAKGAYHGCQEECCQDPQSVNS